MRFMMTPEEIAAQTKELAELKAKAGVKPGFFETTAGTVTVGVVGAAIGAGAGYLLFSGKGEEPATAKK